MRRTFELFDELREIIQEKSGIKIAGIADRYLEGLSVGRDLPLRQDARSVSLTISRKRRRPVSHASALSLVATSSSRPRVVHMP
jgi:hypothetical protein